MKCSRCKKREAKPGFKTCYHCLADRSKYIRCSMTSDGTEELTLDKFYELCNKDFTQKWF